ncbi:hypothetical protein EMIT0P44_210019 [Pseudomonas sp. IT-P44]|uniref:hypothetical protein n=1 Tax=unclassified Pseudomonas TaxID=196821 RepID=UPI0017834DBD|nr:hypothetical protein [Pseudomonas sp. PDM02]MBD9611460.1 hypothetical protein [Pseudomonas sp. PDM02]
MAVRECGLEVAEPALERFTYADASMESAARNLCGQPIRYLAKQRIEPVKTYCYDTLYQLIEATGCEAKTTSGGLTLPTINVP